MTAIRLDGKKLAQQLQSALSQKVSVLTQETGIRPGLAVVLVGDDPASRVYVANKEKQAKQAGFHSHVVRLSENASQKEVADVVENLNHDTSIHGILLQLPLPKHLDELALLQVIDADKDVDGFHPNNVGKFFQGQKSVKPCTPYGVMRLLDAYKIDISGKTAVVVGRSNIVGKPMGQMLLQRDATVIMAHSKTKNLFEWTKKADIVVVAIGKGHFLKSEHIKEGAVIIDVGVNHDENGKLIGDVDPSVVEKASYLTPVPGGVGPMTIAMLLEQTYQQTKASLDKRGDI